MSLYFFGSIKNLLSRRYKKNKRVRTFLVNKKKSIRTQKLFNKFVLLDVLKSPLTSIYLGIEHREGTLLGHYFKTWFGRTKIIFIVDI